jgi:AraC-like DNA-binding protein
MKHILHIKNMVCNRCTEAVTDEFDKAHISVRSISLGKVVLDKELTKEKYAQLEEALAKRGFELLKDQKAKVIDQIKSMVVQQIHHSKKPIETNFSTLISDKLAQEYSSLSKLFSSVEGVTIEKYILKQKVEKVKELLIYNEMNLSQIAFQLGYSSVAHLSAQFKKETGMTPSQFKKTRPNRKTIDSI